MSAIASKNDTRNTTATSSLLLQTLAPFDEVVLASHINPDPDALASMLGLRLLLTAKHPHQRSIMTLEGIIARAENQAMVEALGIDLVPFEEVTLGPSSALVLVDTQPLTGQGDYAGRTPVAVLDHHETGGALEGVPFVDLRGEVGATSTLVVSYLIEQGVAIDARTATALFYGIESDTSGYPRESSACDDVALEWLYPRVEKDLLARIKNPRLPQSYFATFQHALSNAFLYNDVIVCYCGCVPQPDIIAEVADFFIRFDQVAWVLCLGLFESRMRISVRVDHVGGHAGEVLRAVVHGLGVAGGHDRRAGGVIALDDTSPQAVDRLLRNLRRRFLEHVDGDEHMGRRLLDAAPRHPVP